MDDREHTLRGRDRGARGGPRRDRPRLHRVDAAARAEAARPGGGSPGERPHPCEGGALQPGRQREGPTRARADRGRGGPRPARGRDDRRGDERQHRHLPRDGGRRQGLPPPGRREHEGEPGEAPPAARARRRGPRDPERPPWGPAPLHRRREAARGGDPRGRVPGPVPLPGERPHPRGAHRPRDPRPSPPGGGPPGRVRVRRRHRGHVRGHRVVPPAGIPRHPHRPRGSRGVRGSTPPSSTSP